MHFLKDGERWNCMKYAIVYSSKTGNTKMLAEEAEKVLKDSECVYYGIPDQKAAEADMLFVGFWTDKGDCDEDAREFLKSLTGKEIFLFGTAGFGGSQDYFASILARAASYLKSDNTVVGSYMCQGKMPMSVKERYQKMAQAEPEKAKRLLDGFEMALTHPDEMDLLKLHNAVVRAVK